ncbi:MAG TPA: chromate transporter [Burkholderiales bacterium]|nr:chromate transporter [Burkholderiales bacterium]
MIPQDAVGARRPAPRHAAELFVAFMRMGLSGFGGVLPWARRALVERLGWLSAEEFTDVLSRCQALPGPNIVNVSICVGARFDGARGAFAACAGLLFFPFVIVLSLGVLYARFAHLAVVAHAVHGVAAAAAGLLLATAMKMAADRRLRTWTALFGLLTFCAVGLLRWPMLPVLLALAPPSIGLAWLRRGR